MTATRTTAPRTTATRRPPPRRPGPPSVEDLEDTRPRLDPVRAAGAGALGGAAAGAAALGAAGSGAPDTTHELPRLTPASDDPSPTDAGDDRGDDDGGVEDVFGAYDDEATRVIPLPLRPPAAAGPGEGPQPPSAFDDADDDSWDDGEADDAGAWDDGSWDGGEGSESEGSGGREAVGRPGEGRGAAAAAGAAAAGAAVAGALGTVGERVGGLARRAVNKVSELSPDTTAGRPSGDLEAPAPLVPSEPLTKDESKLALAIVAVFLVVALIIGVWGITRIGANSDLSLGGPGSSTGTTSAPPSSGTPSAETSEAPSGAVEPLAIFKVEAYDPSGDGAENNRLTPKTYDGDKGVGWFSENYRTDEFGGLKKGLGVIVDLGPNKKPQGIELTIEVASDIKVYVGPDNRLEGATKVGEKTKASGTVTFEVPADVSGQYIIVWYTKLTADDRGKRRAWLNEVVVTG